MKPHGLRWQLRSLLGRSTEVAIVPYRGFGTPKCLQLTGRVLLETDRRSVDQDSTWGAVQATIRRFASHELAGVPIRAQLGEANAETVTDDEGYFAITLSADAAPFAPGWHEVIYTAPDLDASSETQGAALAVADDAEFGVISDIDDTVLQTHATDLVKMLRTTVLQNARTRLPFAGVAEFYQALHAGSDGQQENPIFYLSSSPWNLYDLLVDFMRINGLPDGPLLLQDYGFDEGKLLKHSHAEHKLTRLRQLFDLYPTLAFVLIGDSGQHDPELYAQVVAEYPDRVRAVYIRDVSDAQRDAEVVRLTQQAADAGVDLLLTPDSATAARHAVQAGLIASSGEQTTGKSQ